MKLWPALLLGLLLVGCGGAPPPSPVRLPTPTPGLIIVPTPGHIATIQGNGNVQTDPIPVAPGAYQVHWQITNPSAASCHTAASLRHADAPDPAALAIADQTLPPGQQQSGRVDWTVPTGGYYRVRVLSNCAWVLQIGAP